ADVGRDPDAGEELGILPRLLDAPRVVGVVAPHPDDGSVALEDHGERRTEAAVSEDEHDRGLRRRVWIDIIAHRWAQPRRPACPRPPADRRARTLRSPRRFSQEPWPRSSASPPARRATRPASRSEAPPRGRASRCWRGAEG